MLHYIIHYAINDEYDCFQETADRKGKWFSEDFGMILNMITFKKVIATLERGEMQVSEWVEREIEKS